MVADGGRGSRIVRVMLIEDDALLRGLIAGRLGDEGLEVDGLASAEDALILLGAGQMPDVLVADVLVADVNLGRGLSGRDLAQIARERHLGVDVVLIGGAPRPALHPLRHERFLRKPFAPEALAAAIRAAAAASSPQSP
jgi:DNA-binding response OmpR family regulator